MTITFKKLIGASEALRKLSMQEFDISKAVEVSRFMKKLEKEFDVFKENHEKLVKKYGKLKDADKGAYEFDEQGRKDFNREYEKLLNLECKIDGEKIEINESIKLSPANVIALEDFIEFKG